MLKHLDNQPSFLVSFGLAPVFMTTAETNMTKKGLYKLEAETKECQNDQKAQEKSIESQK